MRFFPNAAVRRLLLPVLVATAVAPATAGVVPADAGAAPAPPYSKADYWALADHMAPGQHLRWSASDRAYANGARAASVRTNSAMLVTHAIAALDSHDGPTRQDERARVLADRLSTAPVWLGAASVRRGGGPLSTCWGMSVRRPVPQHPSLEPKVADALAWAWRARRALHLRSDVVRRIEQRVGACARSRAWRRGARVANQINWNAELYASAVTVGAGRGLLLRDYRRLLSRFATGITRPGTGARTANLGRGYQFHYQPNDPDTAGINLDSPEYANIVMHAIAYHDRARRLGMRPLSSTQMSRMRAWTTRLLAGSWTHAGYLNWDTGKGYRRWHSAQYWAFAQQGLLAVATSPEFRSENEGRWAKALFDRGLQLHRRLADESGARTAPPRMFGVPSLMESYDVFCSRILANIAKAIALGLGSRPAQDPPPLYAYDHDTGRLAVTTPHYSTAIVPDNRGVFEYGGIDPARLFGPDQVVAGNLGGTGAAALGVVLTDAAGHRVLSSQGRRGRIRVVRSPHGDLSAARAYPARPYAGRFGVIVARGLVRGGGVAIRAAHEFRHDEIISRWRVSCSGGCADHRLRAHFPTYGRDSAIDATLRHGGSVRLAGPGTDGAGRVALEDIAGVILGDGRVGGYRLSDVAASTGARLLALSVSPQVSNPRPGPTLAVELRGEGNARSMSVSVRMKPIGRFSPSA